MSEKTSVCFLVRKLPKDAKKLHKDVAVVSLSVNAKSPHYIFEEAHHSLKFHPELERQLLQIPVKHRHIIVTLTREQAQKYLNAGLFQFNGQPLRLWRKEIHTLTGN